MYTAALCTRHSSNIATRSARRSARILDPTLEVPSLSCLDFAAFFAEIYP